MQTRSRRWIGFFVVLGVLATAGIVIPIVYNLRIQLRPEQLTDARQRWRENAPVDYDLKCLIKTTHAEAAQEDMYLVKVRGGRTVFVVYNEEVLWVDPSLAFVAGPAVLALASEDTAGYGVAALFDQIETTLKRDATAERRNLIKATFDPHDGHPSHYIHRVRGTKDQIEWFVKFTPASKSER